MTRTSPLRRPPKLGPQAAEPWTLSPGARRYELPNPPLIGSASISAARPEVPEARVFKAQPPGRDAGEAQVASHQNLLRQAGPVLHPEDVLLRGKAVANVAGARLEVPSHAGAAVDSQLQRLAV